VRQCAEDCHISAEQPGVVHFDRHRRRTLTRDRRRPFPIDVRERRDRHPFFGDGSARAEWLNLASVWNLPILNVYENNQFLAFVRRQVTMLTDHIAGWTRLKGIETATIDRTTQSSAHCPELNSRNKSAVRAVL
jgi:hypothetical protein